MGNLFAFLSDFLASDGRAWKVDCRAQPLVGPDLAMPMAKLWPYSDIRSCCCQYVHAFISRYDSTLLGCAVFTLKVFLHEITVYRATAFS